MGVQKENNLGYSPNEQEKLKKNSNSNANAHAVFN